MNLVLKNRKVVYLFNSIFLLMIAILTYFLLSPVNIWTLDNMLRDIDKIILGTQLALLLLAYIFLYTSIELVTVRFTVIDIVLGIYIIYLFFHTIILKPIHPNPVFVTEHILLCIIYIIYRNIKYKQLKYLYWVLIFATLHQLYYGILHQTGGFTPGYGLSDIKGRFINQGPFAGFIACIIIVNYGLLLNNLHKIKLNNTIKKWIKTLLLIVVFIIILTTLIYSNSRASWLASLIGLLFYNWKKYGTSISVNKLVPSLKGRISFYIILTVLIVGIAYSLYQFKKGSADGRILIWKVTIGMIKDKPLLGHGVDTFQSNYMQYQADYFKENGDDQYQYLASDNNYAFNEFLRIGSEQGLIGILIIAILGYIIIHSIKKGKNSINNNFYELIPKSGLIVFFVFGLFSYPTEILQIKIVAVFFIAILANSSNTIPVFYSLKSNYPSRIHLSKIKRGIFLVVILVVFSLSWHKITEKAKIYKDWNFALLEMKRGNYTNYISFSENNFQKLKNNGYFLGSYGYSLFKEQEYVKAIKIFEQAVLLMPSTKIYIDIGECYNRLENYNKAEFFWKKASNMVPVQFKPEYLIAKMYFENGQKEKARKIALNLLKTKKIKIYSIEVYEIIEELHKIIDG